MWFVVLKSVGNSDIFFNFLGPDGRSDIASLQSKLGQLYRLLSFQYVYRSLESKAHFEEMVKDGWFPFIEILGEEYKTLTHVYQNKKFTYDNTVGELLGTFDESRVNRIADKWWMKPIFQKKQQLIQAGNRCFPTRGRKRLYKLHQESLYGSRRNYAPSVL